jgi:hypothetical protein
VETGADLGQGVRNELVALTKRRSRDATLVLPDSVVKRKDPLWCHDRVVLCMTRITGISVGVARPQTREIRQSDFEVFVGQMCGDHRPNIEVYTLQFLSLLCDAIDAPSAGSRGGGWGRAPYNPNLQLKF